ncbi:MAG: hypothetical protein AB8G22_16090 [Saprospiraceae bacterium]
MYTLQIKDETAIGDVLNKIQLQFETEYITVEELIKARIATEIERYESNLANYRTSLVQPTHLEQRLNQNSAPKIDLEKQWYIALQAFQENGFFILVDDEQVDELHQKVHVDESTEVSFIKLTPLVGG